MIGGSGGYPGRGEPCSGYLVGADGFTILIDPGYGVAMALTTEDAPRFDAVLVSHGHPDHCADLNPAADRAWAEVARPPLPVFAPAGALDAVLALDRPEVVAGSHVIHELEPGERVTLGPFQVRTALLPHPRPNLGFRIGAGRGSLVYTGDSRPVGAADRTGRCDRPAPRGVPRTPTVPQEIVGMLSSAADVGREAALAGPRRLVLTHLMPGTDEAEAVAAAARSFDGPIAVARPGLDVDI